MKTFSNKNVAYILNVAMLMMAMISVKTIATETTLDTSNAVKKNSISKKAPLVINSQVKGSQEQPNVIYIMPWQGIDNPISIEGNTQKIVLPHFKPINPKSFKKQVKVFYKVNSNQHK
jgi:hypothetical protein